MIIAMRSVLLVLALFVSNGIFAAEKAETQYRGNYILKVVGPLKNPKVPEVAGNKTEPVVVNGNVVIINGGRATVKEEAQIMSQLEGQWKKLTIFSSDLIVIRGNMWVLNSKPPGRAKLNTEKSGPINFSVFGRLFVDDV
ncbi:hypothetical protein TKK_0004631 [Trichogramma kaykai]